MAIQPVHTESVYQGRFVELVVHTLRTRSGKEYKKEVLQHPGAVIILPVAPDGRIVFIRNQRVSVHEELLELPAGTLERGEDPALCAGRELIEETGYHAGKIESLGWFYTSPGILSEKMYVFVATDIVAGAQELEDYEEIKVELFTRPEIERMLLDNTIRDAKTIATLHKYWLKGR
ncbi:MAG: NUDIX hydrolase [Phycisphaerae bacterium]